MTNTKIKEHVSFESSEKEKLAYATFSKMCDIACAINHAGQLIYLVASLHERGCGGLIDKTTLKSKVQ